MGRRTENSEERLGRQASELRSLEEKLGGEARFGGYTGCESEAGDRRLEGKFYILSQEEAF